MECKLHGGQGLIISNDNLRGEMQNMLELLEAVGNKYIVRKVNVKC